MISIGLTGSIGMGKSTVARMFAEAGACVWSADDAVHRLYSKGGAGAAPVGAAFPEAIVDGAVDRDRLAARVLSEPAARQRLEAIVHPLVGEDRAAFLKDARARNADLVVLDIPLLFESGGETAVDVVVVVSAPADVQRARVLARDGMTEQKFEAILAAQTPDAEKRARADYIVDTGVCLEETRAEVVDVVQKIRDRFSARPRGSGP